MPPLLAAVPVILGSTAGATLAASAVGAAGTLYASSQQNKNTKKQIANQTATTDKILAANQAQQDRARQDYSPAVNVGNSALDQLAQKYGLSPAAGPGGSSDGVDWAAYLNNNPDARQWVNDVKGTPNDQFGGDEVALAKYHYQADGSRRELPKVAVDPKPDGGPAGTSPDDPMTRAAPTFARPDQGSAPDAGGFFGDYEETEDYKFLRDKALKGVNNSFGARGVLRSGGAARELMREASALASLDKNQWFGRQNTLYQSALQQFNLDRGNTNDNFNSDRGYDTSKWADARDYATNRDNTQTDNLFRLTGVGQSALGAVTSAGSTATANNSNALQAGTSAVNGLYQQKADTNSALAGALSGFGQSALGAFGGSRGGYTPVPTSTVYDAAQYPYRTPPFNPGALTTMPQPRF